VPTVFIAGSIAISKLQPPVSDRIDSIIDKGMDIVVGDADGVDSAIQAKFADMRYDRVTVYCSGSAPRNNLGGWPVHAVFPDAAPGTRAFFTAKDVEMAGAADYGLMIWDAKSPGTLSNVIELIAAGKKAVVFVNRDKEFATVSDVSGLRLLADRMSASARIKAEDKIKLNKRMTALAAQQQDFAF
jgi:hypothetical protein